MEDCSIVELVAALLVADGMRPFALAFGEVDEVCDRLGRLFLEEACDNLAFAGVEDGISSGFTGH